jgi:uncharacterized protein YcnI
MRRAAFVAAIVFAATAVEAHVTVWPRESRAGAGERYTVRVPTEGKVPTTSIELEVPVDVTVTGILASSGYTYEVKREADRIRTITWKQEIKPGEYGEFVFFARNPKAEQIAWKVRQRYADGTGADWVGPVGDRRPASVTKLLAADAPAAQSGDEQKIAEWLNGYDAAFNAKNLDQLANFYHPEVTIYEGGGINNGWADYRDHHLGPELKALENLQFGRRNTKVRLLGDGRSAYAVSEYFIKGKTKDRDIDGGGLETLVLIRMPDGAWKIRHSHTSSRRRPATQ